MMGASWESLLRALVEVRDRNYRSDPERDEARRDNLEWIVQTMLENLRDEAVRTPAMSESQRLIEHTEPYVAVAPTSIGVLLMKRGLFYRPGWRGYTADPDEAGRYDWEVAKRHVRNTEGVTIYQMSELLKGPSNER
jgi:hypothetical protein